MKKSRLLGAVCACVTCFISIQSQSAVLPLESRLGGKAYYDSNLDITWVTNANLRGSWHTWDTMMTWAENLTVGGVTGWRLPNADVNGDGVIVSCFGADIVGCNDNEMGFLFLEEGVTSASPDPFINLIGNSSYWTSTLSPPSSAFAFRFGQGVSHTDRVTSLNYGWAVHDGDVGAVPIPPALWLFGSGLLGLIGVARRKKAA